MQTVKVLSDAPNFNVVKSEGRRFPGLVVQGDRLHEWLALAEAGDRDSVQLLADALTESVAHLDRVCADHGLTPPA